MRNAMVGLGVASVLLAGAVLGPGFPTAGAEGEGAGAKYVGVGKCKMCHSNKSKGDTYGKWKESKHAKAWDALASEEARAIAKSKGISDPQTSDQCLKCHVTAFGVAGDRLDKKFDPKLGVQCETCHGPGETHAKSRLADEDKDDASVHKKAQQEMPLSDPKVLCAKCHNAESPTIEKSPFWDGAKKEFDFEKARKEIEHTNPKWHK